MLSIKGVITMKKRILLLVLCFLIGCTSTNIENTRSAPSEIGPSMTPRPTLTPTITPTFTLTPTPTPAFISHENVFGIVPIKTITGKPFSFGFNKVAFSPDFSTYTTVDDSVALVLWNAVTGEQISTITTEDLIIDVDFSPDGKTIAIEHTNIISLWDAATGNEIQTIPCQISNGGIEFSSDSRTVFTGAAICDVTNGQTLTRFDSKFHSDCFSLALSPDGKVAACTSDVGYTIGQHDIILADVDTGKLVKTLNAEDAYPSKFEYFRIRSLAFSSDGKTLASIDSQNKIALWDIMTGTLISSFDPISQKTGLRFDEKNTGAGFTESDSLIALSPNGKILAAGYAFGSIIFWDVETAKPIYILRADVPARILYSSDHSKAIDSIVFSADGRMLAAADGNNSAVIWGLSSEPQTSSGTPTSLAVQGELILDTAGSYPATKNFSEASKADTYPISTNGGTFSILLNADGNSNICYLVWQVRPSSNPNGQTDMFGDSNMIGSFTISQPGDYVISIVRARITDQCQPFSYTLKVAQP